MRRFAFHHHHHLVLALLWLVAAVCSFHVTAVDGQSTTTTTSHRNLQNDTDRPACQSSYGMVTAQQVKDAGRLFLEPLLSADVLDQAADVLFRTVQYDFEVLKLCTSCEDIDMWFFENDWVYPVYHKKYCGAASNGWGVNQSAVVFFPKDGNTGAIFDHVQLRPFFSFLASPEDLAETPTELWTTVSIPDMIRARSDTNSSTAADDAEAFQAFMSNYLPAMHAAASGSISIIPDYMGYGESVGQVRQAEANRAFLWNQVYEQAGTLHFYNVQQYLHETTNGCTTVDDAVSFYGVEDGAFGVIFAAQALQRFQIRSLSVFAGPGPMDAEVLLEDTVWAYDHQDFVVSPPVVEEAASVNGSAFGTSPTTTTTTTTTTPPPPPPLQDVLSMFAYAYSIDTNNMPNSGTGQRMASEAWLDSLVQRYTFGDNDQDRPTHPLDVLNADLLHRIRESFNSTESACAGKNSTTGNTTTTEDDDNDNDGTTTTALCDSIREASAFRALRGDLGRNWIYPLELCFSPDDELYDSTRHYPEWIWTNPKEIENVNVYRGGIALEEQLAPRGSHFNARQLCAIHPFLFYNLQGHLPDDESDWPHYQAPLSPRQEAICMGWDMPTSAPTGTIASTDNFPTPTPKEPDEPSSSKSSASSFFTQYTGTEWVVASIVAAWIMG